jgi:hypothetical protein
MADDVISLEKVIDFAKTLSGDAFDSVTKFVEGLKNLGQTTTNTSEVLKLLGTESGTQFSAMAEGLKKVTENCEEAFDKFGVFGRLGKQAVSIITTEYEKLTSQMGIASHGSETAGVMAAISLERFLGIIPDTVNGIGNIGQAGVEAGSKISTAFEAVGQIFPKRTAEMVKGADAAYLIKSKVLEAAAAQGRFSETLDSTGRGFRDLNTHYNDYVMLSLKSAQATGQTVASMNELQDKLKAIPGSLSENITVGGVQMNQMVATSKVAAAFGKTQEEVAVKYNELYTNMGVSGQAAFESLSNIYRLAGDSSKLRGAFVTTVLDIAKSFNILGDNTDAATKVVKAFDQAFDDSKLSPDAIQKVITGLTAGVQKFDLARGAFISGATGGPGGLAGGLKMEYALQTGNLEEVMAKTLRGIESQFGGQIVTLKEAVENPGLSSEYLKQMQMISQMTGINDERQASQVLNAMKEGVIGKLERGEKDETTDALEQAIDLGTQKQDPLRNSVMQVYQKAEEIRLTQDLVYQEMMKSTDIELRSALNLEMIAADAASRDAAKGGLFIDTTESRTDKKHLSLTEDFNEAIDWAKKVFGRYTGKQEEEIISKTESTKIVPEEMVLKLSEPRIPGMPTSEKSSPTSITVPGLPPPEPGGNILPTSPKPEEISLTKETTPVISPSVNITQPTTLPQTSAITEQPITLPSTIPGAGIPPVANLPSLTVKETAPRTSGFIAEKGSPITTPGLPEVISAEKIDKTSRITPNITTETKGYNDKAVNQFEKLTSAKPISEIDKGKESLPVTKTSTESERKTAETGTQIEANKTLQQHLASIINKNRVEEIKSTSVPPMPYRESVAEEIAKGTRKETEEKRSSIEPSTFKFDPLDLTVSFKIEDLNGLEEVIKTVVTNMNLNTSSGPYNGNANG